MPPFISASAGFGKENYRSIMDRSNLLNILFTTECVNDQISAINMKSY